MGVLDLRNAPMRTLGCQAFYVDNRNRIQLGFPVELTEDRIWLREGFRIRVINRLVPRPSQYYGRDYYFPYRQQAAECVVVQHPPEGCIAVTGGMNGCALEVTLRHGVYTFYHDANGENMHRVGNAGTRVCRIEADAYWDDHAIEALMVGMPPPAPIVQFVCVYKAGYWHVGCTGLLLRGDRIVGTFVPKGGKYRGYFNDTFHLMQYH